MDNKPETLIVYVDDALYARQQLAPLMQDAKATRWVLVACPPHMSRRVGKWLSHSARVGWRKKWSADLAEKIAGWLAQPGSTVEHRVAKEPLVEFTAELQANCGVGRVIDARRPKFGVQLQPITPQQPTESTGWQLPAAVSGLGAALIIAAE
ncbi:MAG: hypothetical protein RLZZ126_172 [Pseudomonadota bacterium]|jgi:hypothetical protein